MKKCIYLVIAGMLFSQPLLVSATEISESNTQVSIEITEEQGENSIPTVTSEKEDNPIATSESKETEQTDVPEKELPVTKEENISEMTNSTEEANEQVVKSGSVQTDDYDWDEETGTLTVKKGEFQRTYPAVNSLDVEKIIFNEGVTFPKNSYHLFADYRDVKSIEGLEKIDTSNVTDMGGMFYGLSSLTSLDVSQFDTSNVMSMTDMFIEMSSLTSLDVSHFNTSNVKDMSLMFTGMSSLTSLDVSQFDTSNVMSMTGMFRGLSSLTSLDISQFDTSNVKNMGLMFYEMSSLTSLDVSQFDTSNVWDMQSMFYGMSSLTSLDVSQFDTSNVKNMRAMFYGMSSLTSLDVSQFDTSNITDMSWMFYGMSSLTSLDVSQFDTSNVTDMSWMFYKMFSLTSLDVSQFDTSNVTAMRAMFYGTNKLSRIVLGEKTKLDNTIRLETLKEGPEYTGNWAYIEDANGNKPSNPLSLSDAELMNYDGSYPGTYVWEKKQGQPVTIQYVDEEGKNLAEATELTGLFGEPYEAHAKEIEGYVLDEDQLPENKTGTFTDQKQIVTFVYKKESVKAGDVTVRYEDEAGKELSTPVVLSGYVGDRYESERKEIDGYTFKEVKGNPTGKFTETEQTVTYIYKKEPVKAGDVMVRYEDEAGNELSESVVLSGDIGDPYSSKQKDFPGYMLKEVKGKASGTFGVDPQQVVYVYQKDSSTDQSTTSNDKKPTDSTPPTEKGETRGDVTAQSQKQESVPPTVVQNQSVTSNPKQELVKKENKSRKDGTLPQTNEQITPFFSLAGVILVGITLLSGLWYKQKKK